MPQEQVEGVFFLYCAVRIYGAVFVTSPRYLYISRHVYIYRVMFIYTAWYLSYIARCLYIPRGIYPSGHFNIHEFVQFCSHPTRAGQSFKLKHLLCRSNYERNFYFNRIPRLWNSLPFLDITLSLSVIKSKLRAYFWDHFMLNFNSNNLCTYHYLCPCPKCSQLPVKMHFNVSLYNWSARPRGRHVSSWDIHRIILENIR